MVFAAFVDTTDANATTDADAPGHRQLKADATRDVTIHAAEILDIDPISSANKKREVNERDRRTWNVLWAVVHSLVSGSCLDHCLMLGRQSCISQQAHVVGVQATTC